MRRLDIHLYDGESFDLALRTIEASDPVDYVVMPLERKDRRLISVFLRDGSGQALMDGLQTCLESHKDWRVSLVPIEATVPKLEEPDERKAKTAEQTTREEIFTDVSAGAKLDRDFVVLVVLSTIVAGIGLNADGIAAVIGAMVIAPLLGPILGLSLAIAMGEDELLLRSGKTLVIGIIVALGVAIILALLIPVNLQSEELISRAEVRLDGVALAMAAGGAAALSLAKGQGTALVGVMVAAALLPPGAAVGLFLGAQEWALASRSGLLLALNVAALILSALLVFRAKGIAPRKWLERENANRAVWINAAISAIFLIVVCVLIVKLNLGQKIEIGS